MDFNLPKKISAKGTTVVIHQIFTATFLPYSSTYIHTYIITWFDYVPCLDVCKFQDTYFQICKNPQC